MIELPGVVMTEGVVSPEWIDINGHMNVAYYVLAFDKANDSLWAQLGVTDEYIRTTNGSSFAVECHVTYQRELRQADPFRITTEILAYDEKRIHQFQRMYHARENYLAATAEWMHLHVDLGTRKVRPWPNLVLEALRKFTSRQRNAKVPQEAGKKMTIARPIYSLLVRNAGT